LIKEEVDLFAQLQKDPNAVLVMIYKEYRKEFLSWAYKTYGADEDNSSDSFQDALIVLYNNVQSGKLTGLKSSIKTYLFSIGKNILLNRFKATRRMTPLSNHDFSDFSIEPFELPELYEGNSLENKVAVIIKSLKDPCKSILRYFYFRGLNMEEIAKKMQYKNAQTVKSQKVRCIKEIQRLLKVKMRMN
jgi:RNA polymerase sigma factor (sigma-70 family)